MTINEIKDLAKRLKEEDVEKIKEEIKSKESILKTNSLNEEELGEILNSLFSILVIEKAFEEEIEGVEEIRDDLEKELMDSYEQYDSYMLKFKKEGKKKKKKWLLNFLFLSDDIHNKRDSLGKANKLINRLQNQVNELKSQRTNDNMKKVCDHGHRRERDKFCDCSKDCRPLRDFQKEAKFVPPHEKEARSNTNANTEYSSLENNAPHFTHFFFIVLLFSSSFASLKLL